MSSTRQLVSRYAKDPLCKDCGKKKGPRQLDQMRCATCQRLARRTAAEKTHGNHILVTYGITTEQYRALLAYQAGKCAICIKATGRSKRLAVDHDHSCRQGHDPKRGCPECVRGLLCSRCNGFLGWIRDDHTIGGRIGRYLDDPPFQQLRKKREHVQAA